jgi:predicted acyltransferase
LYSGDVSDRLSSVDAFRGLTMAAMVIVNNPGTWDAIYWPLEHAPWHGWTPTDLIFPFFVFLVGVSLTLSRQTRTAPPRRIVQRALVIIGLGLFMAGFPYFRPHGWRIPGVLQRIGLCYLAAAFIYRRAPQDPRKAARILGWTSFAMLVLYWLVLAEFGDLTEAGNVGARIDRALMAGHMLKPNWDPEGLLSTLPAIATTLLGAVAGLWLKTPVPREKQVNVLALAGIASFAAGQAWHAVLPINKQLWTSSYVVLTAGAAAILLAACIYVIDIRGYHAWSRPFVVLGRNAITLFVVAGLLAKMLDLIVVRRPDGAFTTLQGEIYERGFAWMGPPKIASLSYAAMFLVAMYAVCYLMYRRGIFLKA